MRESGEGEKEEGKIIKANETPQDKAFKRQTVNPYRQRRQIDRCESGHTRKDRERASKAAQGDSVIN